MRTSLDLCFCLLTLCGITPVLYGVKVFAEEDSDAVLNCSASTKENITGKTFDWKKDGQKEVFLYDSGIHHNNGRPGQDEQFKGRVSHFQDQLMNGNASIKITRTKMTDSGNYSCNLPLLKQTFNTELVVAEYPKPHVTTLVETKDWSLLHCEVRGVSPKPKVEWQDSSGNILPAEKPQVSERRGRYYITININVTKTGRYRCVVTQEEISHQSYSEIFVFINEDQSTEVELWRTATIVLAVLVVVLLLAGAGVYCICRNFQQRRYRSDESTPIAAEPQRPQVTYSTTTPHDMEQENNRRASVNRADTEPTQRHKHGVWKEACRDAAAPLKQGIIKTLMDRSDQTCSRETDLICGRAGKRDRSVHRT